MTMNKIIFSLAESPTHPNFADLYASLGFQEQRFNAMRKAISALKKTKPDCRRGIFLWLRKQLCRCKPEQSGCFPA